MPFLSKISVAALPGGTPEEKLNSIVKQLNEWSSEISNEAVASIQRGLDGSVRIVQGTQTIDGTTVVGTVYYDESNIDRIFIGLHPTDSRPGIWISKDGESVIGLLTA